MAWWKNMSVLLADYVYMYYRERKEYINPQLLALKKKKKKITKPPSQGRAQINQQGNFGRAQINPPRQLWARPYQSARQLWARPYQSVRQQTIYTSPVPLTHSLGLPPPLCVPR